MTLSRTFIATAVLLFGLSGYAQSNPDAPIVVEETKLEVPLVLSLGFGQSLPEPIRERSIVDTNRPSRTVGGEFITVSFRDAKLVDRIRLSAFSRSGRGRVLVRDAIATVAATDAAEESRQSLTGLFLARPETKGTFDDFSGLVMLNNLNYVEIDMSSRITRVVFQVEGYTHDDNSLLVEIFSPDGFQYTDFEVRRQRAPAPTPPPVDDGQWVENPDRHGFCSLMLPGQTDHLGVGCFYGNRYGVKYKSHAVTCHWDVAEAKYSMRSSRFCHRSDRVGSYSILFIGQQDANGNYCHEAYGVLYRGHLATWSCFYHLDDAMDEMRRLAH